jgi:hypothetical protein
LSENGIDVVTQRATQLIESRQFGEAETLLLSARERFPWSPWPQMLLAQLAIRSGTDGAWQFVRSALDSEHADANVYAMGAHLLLQGGHRELETVLDEGLNRFPFDPRLLRMSAARRFGAREGSRPVIAVFGNCQAEAVESVIVRLPSLADRFEFVVIPTALPAGRTSAFRADVLQRCVLLWEQHDDQPQAREIVAQVRAAIGPQVPVVRFPPIAQMCFWPFAARNAENKPEPDFPWGRFRMGDRVAAEVARMGLPAGRVYERYMELSRQKMPDPSRLLTRDRRFNSQMEETCDVTFSEFVNERFRSERLFWSWAHLSRRMHVVLTETLLRASGDVIEGVDVCLEQVRAIEPFLPEYMAMQLPIHPDVIESFGLTFVTPESTYSWFGNYWTFEEYITRYITKDRNWGVAYDRALSV